MIYLSIARDYCPEWGVWEGVRELVQNWMDAFQEGDTIMHDGEETLTLINRFAAPLERRNIAVLGRSEKHGCDTQRGEFGEGLKIGCLALERCGCHVAIRSRTSEYQSQIAHSDAHGSYVLAFQCTDAAAEVPGVCVTIHGLSLDQWQNLKARFLFDDRGPILADQPGKVFVKGIWVCNVADFSLGYNLAQGKTGRNRDVIDGFDLRWEVAQILAQALQDGTLNPHQVLQMLEDEAGDVEHLSSFLGVAGRTKLAAAWTERHGEKGVPVANDIEYKNAEHTGNRPVVATANLVACVPDEIKARGWVDPVLVRYEWHELTAQERSSVDYWRHEIGIPNIPELQIVKFADDRQMGRRDGGTIQIARSVLSHRYRTLQTLIEELAHDAGPDGSFAHKWRLHILYTDIIRKMQS